jgi:hypothetical protein
MNADAWDEYGAQARQALPDALADMEELEGRLNESLAGTMSRIERETHLRVENKDLLERLAAAENAEKNLREIGNTQRTAASVIDDSRKYRISELEAKLADAVKALEECAALDYRSKHERCPDICKAALAKLKS